MTAASFARWSARLPTIASVGLALSMTRGSLAAQAAPEVARLKQAYLADFTDLEKKLVALAEAFPAEKFSWRPMDGVRSVGAVVGLIAGENYGFPRSYGGKAPTGVPSEEALEKLTDKTALVRHLRESFAAAKQAIAAWSGKPEGPIQLWGEGRTLAGAFMVVMADQHEHLGQLIAYARMNRIVPPWSK
ncbi:MAG: DinB family protein [Gemmatimonadota bacterium]